MRRVLASGVFDQLHDGHRFYLAEAKRLGGHLTVIVTSDSHAAASKRTPTQSATHRAEAVAAIPEVDDVALGLEPYDLLAMVRLTKPDVIALGHDQSFDSQQLQKQLADAGFSVEVVRLSKKPGDHISTTHLLGEQ